MPIKSGRSTHKPVLFHNYLESGTYICTLTAGNTSDEKLYLCYKLKASERERCRERERKKERSKNNIRFCENNLL